MDLFSESEKQEVSKDGAVGVMLSQRATEKISADGLTVDLVFPTVEDADVFRRAHSAEVGKKYQGRMVRWRGREWANKPGCKREQADILGRLQKWDQEDHDRYASDCLCKSCVSTTVPWAFKDYKQISSEGLLGAVGQHIASLPRERAADYVLYLKNYCNFPRETP